VHLLKQFPDVVAELLHSEDVAEFEDVGASNLSVGEKEESKKTYLMKLNESSEKISPHWYVRCWGIERENKDRVERFSPHWYVRCCESWPNTRINEVLVGAEWQVSKPCEFRTASSAAALRV
jgi:hypothetical protein